MPVFAVWKNEVFGPQMTSRGTLQSPSEPLGAPFGYEPYFKTLLDVTLRHFDSTLASLGGSFWEPFRHLSSLGRSWDRKMGSFGGIPFDITFLIKFRSKLDAFWTLKTLIICVRGCKKSAVRLCRILDHFKYHLRGHFRVQNTP